VKRVREGASLAQGASVVEKSCRLLVFRLRGTMVVVWQQSVEIGRGQPYEIRTVVLESGRGVNRTLHL